MLNISEIKIVGLFGETDVAIPVKDNRIIIVGYNGVGKSTILNIFYYFISQQWSKLEDQDFMSVALLLNDGNILHIDRQALIEFNQTRPQGLIWRSRSRSFNYPNRLTKELMIYLENSYKSKNSARGKSLRVGREEIIMLSERFDVPLRVAEDLIREFVYRQAEFELKHEFKPEVEAVASVDKYLSENLNGRILFLPTYRRIEKDIKEIFPEIEAEIQSKLTRRTQDSLSGSNYIELVQFGMQDVRAKINSRLESIRTHALSQVNNLTTKYLRDVIRNEANKFNASENIDIDEINLKNVFDKVDNTVLSDEDKDKISDVVSKIRENEKLKENEIYVAHYVMYLVQIGENISELEQPILEFVSICNSYLYGKKFEFDNTEYKVVIKHDSNRPVEMEDLSSGEKQIVSLFSHLILDDEKKNYIIIDEPELSLSVDWQQRFLHDISRMEACHFIGAVTHSPFIFENDLDEYTIDLLEHVRPIK